MNYRELRYSSSYYLWTSYILFKGKSENGYQTSLTKSEALRPNLLENVGDLFPKIYAYSSNL